MAPYKDIAKDKKTIAHYNTQAVRDIHTGGYLPLRLTRLVVTGFFFFFEECEVLYAMIINGLLYYDQPSHRNAMHGNGYKH